MNFETIYCWLSVKKKKYVAQLQQLSPPTNLYSNIYPDKVCFKHIGLIGDIIYSIPCMLALANGKKDRIVSRYHPGKHVSKGYKHYNKNKILTEKA